MIKGSCHCGAVTFEIAQTPEKMVSCNCSICRRYAALWVHQPPMTSVMLNAPKDATHTYSWGDKSIEFHSCKTCGCITHWQGVDGKRFAVNLRLAEPDQIKDIRVRHFDGADTWEFLD